VRTKEGLRRLSPNHFIMIEKGAWHEYRADEQHPWSIYWMHFNGSLAAKLFSRYRRDGHKENNIPFDKEKVSQFNQIYQILDQEYAPSSLEFANILGLNFVGSFVYTEVEKSSEPDHRQDDLVNRVIDYLTKNL